MIYDDEAKLFELILKASDADAWRAHLLQEAASAPHRWTVDAFKAICRFSTDAAPMGEIVADVASEKGWGGDAPGFMGCLTDACGYEALPLIPWILKAPVAFELPDTEISFMALRALDRGIWSYLDLLDPQIMMDEFNIKRMGHDIFKHNEYTYYTPLSADVIDKLIQLPKHPNTGAILGEKFAIQQRDPDCFTDIDLPGTFDQLLKMTRAGWLDLDAAKSAITPKETRTMNIISQLERDLLHDQAGPATSVGRGRRI